VQINQVGTLAPRPEPNPVADHIRRIKHSACPGFVTERDDIVSGAVKRLEWSPLACGSGQAVRLELAGIDLQGRR